MYRFTSSRRAICLIATGLLVALLLPTSVAAAEGPELLRDLREGGQAGVADLTAVGDRVFFTADDGASGRELYVTDGTFGGTHRVLDINTGAGSANPSELTAVGGRVFFIARDGANGAGLYVSDGTALGTVRLMRRRPCDPNSLALAAVGARLAFASKEVDGTCSLYGTDGTVLGTGLAKANLPSFEMPQQLNGRVVFASNGGGSASLWKSDTLPGGATKVIRTFPDQIADMTATDKLVFLTVGQLFTSSRLWKSDGTSAGTDPVSGAPRNGHHLTELGGKLIFQSWVYDFQNEVWDRSLWRTNGRRAGTYLLKDFGTNQYAGIPDSGIWAGDSRAYFNAGQDLVDYGLWASNGTPTGTHLVAKVTLFDSVTIGNNIFGMGCYRDETTMPVSCDFGHLLFTSDGTADGTVTVDGAVNLQPGLAAAGGSVYFIINGELWRYAP